MGGVDIEIASVVFLREGSRWPRENSQLSDARAGQANQPLWI